MLLVGIMIIISILMFAPLMQRLGDLQIGNVLHLVGDRGRAVSGEMFRRLDDASAVPRVPEGAARTAQLGHPAQAVVYFGKHRTIAKVDVGSLVVLAQRAGGTIVMACAVDDTLVEGAALLPTFMAPGRGYRKKHSDELSGLSAKEPSSRTQSIRSDFSSISQ